ncbi:hypothetical protein SDC9_158486 [bioreactor metagenome]|uniref:Methyl-accepting transducer domain-containing protein n=1 Tax=bioreactor metagenome TaxID=1076179 RepID=A0A645F9W9_9ZZZZ
MKKVFAISKEQTNKVINSREKYILIAEAIKGSENVVAKLNDSGERMQSMKNKIVDTLQNLAAIAEENAASTEEVTASIVEQTAAIEKIANVSLEISKSAENLDLTAGVLNI